MADFSDAEDVLLVRLAASDLDKYGKVEWKKVSLLMLNTGKSKDALRTRLKTLKKNVR